MTETLLESECFGYEKHVFTGAACLRRGNLQRADGGTLFLDEGADLPASRQAKLLGISRQTLWEKMKKLDMGPVDKSGAG